MRQKATRSEASGAIVEYMGAIAGVRPKPYGAIDFYSFGGGSHAAMAVYCHSSEGTVISRVRVKK